MKLVLKSRLRAGGVVALKRRRPRIFLLIIASLHAVALIGRADDIVISRFGRGGYGDWKTTGTEFEKGPASGELIRELEIENAVSDAVLSSEIEGDGPKGTLTSPAFKIERSYIHF